MGSDPGSWTRVRRAMPPLSGDAASPARASWRRARQRRDAVAAPLSGRPSAPTRFGLLRISGVPRSGPAVTTPPSMQSSAAHASALPGSPGIAEATAGFAAGPRGVRMPHCAWWLPWPTVAEPAASRPRVAPSTDRWQSPASWTRRHVCLRGRGGSPRGRTLRPVWTARARHASICGHSRLWLSRASESSCMVRWSNADASRYELIRIKSQVPNPKLQRTPNSQVPCRRSMAG